MMLLVVLLACFCLAIGQVHTDESIHEYKDHKDAVVLLQGELKLFKSNTTDLRVDGHIKSVLQAKSNFSTVLKNATSKGKPKHEFPTLAQREITFQVQSADSVGVNKILYVVLCMTMPCGCCGIDRCFMGQCFLGWMKGLSLGGLGIWFLCDYFVCLYVALARTPELTIAGYDVKFDESTMTDAMVAAIIMMLINMWNCKTHSQRIAEQRAALKELQEELERQNHQQAQDTPVHQHSLPFIPTQLTKALRTAGLVNEKPTVPELTATFKQMDKDGNGKLDREELMEALKAMGTDGDAMDALIKEADVDGDGQISLTEFLKAMNVTKEK